MNKKNMLRHILAVQKTFPRVRNSDPITLYTSLRQLEFKAHNLALKQCNTDIGYEEVERRQEAILEEVDGLLGFRQAKLVVFCNGDARGYGLKMHDKIPKLDTDLERDWGGYIILAPEF